MAMTIMNNTGAMLTLGQLNKNISKVGKELKKVSSGMKLNGAGDDASAFAISEKMLTQFRSLEQDERNVKNGSSLVKVAAGGIDSIVDELRNLKELALNAANDTNTDMDRATMQKEFDQRRANIDSITMETTYNGKILLDGTYSKKSIDIITTTVIPGTPPGPDDSWLKPTQPDIVGPDTDGPPFIQELSSLLGLLLLLATSLSLPSLVSMPSKVSLAAKPESPLLKVYTM